VFLGRDWLRSDPHYSRETGNRIDTLVRSLARESLQEAINLLSPRRALIDRLVDLLIEQETLGGEEFRAVVSRYEAAREPVSAG
jgi:cell division protease FtsH